MAEEKVSVVYSLVDKASSGLKSLGSSVLSAINPFNSLRSAGSAAMDYLTQGIVASIKAAEESRQVMAQTEAVIKSTGGVAGVTAESVTKLADSLSLMTSYDDEAIQSAENLLLTFKGIGNDVFPKTTEAVLDMSAALGTDLKSSAMLVGKALNDPAEGLSKLTRAGVTFTDQQKEQIKAMSESGDKMGAQKIILKELASEFGGSAVAIADPFKQLGNAVEKVQESMGKVLLPIATEVAKKIVELSRGVIGFFDNIDPIPLVRAFKFGLIDMEANARISGLLIKQKLLDPLNPSIYISAFSKLATAYIDFQAKLYSGLVSGVKSYLNWGTEQREKQKKEEFSLEEEILKIRKASNAQKILIDKEYAKLKKQGNSDTNTQIIQDDKNANFITEAAKKESLKRQEQDHKNLFDSVKLNSKAMVDSMTLGGQENYNAQLKYLNDLQLKYAKHKDIVTMLQAEENKIRRDQHLDLANQTLAIQTNMDNLRFAAMDKDAERVKKISEDEKANREGLANDFVAFLGDNADQKLSIEKQVAKGGLDILKRQVLAQVDIWAAGQISQAWSFAWANALWTFGGSLIAAAVQTALIGAAVAAVHSTVNSIQLAEGGVVTARPGGVQATIGEGGSSEAVIPLNSRRGREALGGMGGGTMDVYLHADGMTILTKGIFRKADELKRTGQLSDRSR
jgi:hypothetical protein